jgi:hypothetical protein
MPKVMPPLRANAAAKKSANTLKTLMKKIALTGIFFKFGP